MVSYRKSDYKPNRNFELWIVVVVAAYFLFRFLFG